MEEDQEETGLSSTVLETVLGTVVEEDADVVEKRQTAVGTEEECILTKSGLLLSSLDQTSATKTKAKRKRGGKGSREKREAEIRLKALDKKS